MSLTSPIFKMFGKSPIRPLQQHMSKASEAARTLMAFFAAVLDRDWEKAAISQAEIVRLEHQADQIKQDIRSHLPKSLFMPTPRGDLLQILTMQDKIPNQAKDIAGLVLGRKMHIPEGIANNYLALLKRSIDAVEQAQVAINELDELLETGFRGDEVHVVENMIHKISEVEHDTDEIQIQVRQDLFKIESSLSPVDVIFLYTIIDWTGEIADRAEQVGHLLQLLLAR